MTNKIEQKKEYSAPEMKVVELKHQVNLMSGSTGSEPPPWSKELL
jgi:hypothetical protein